MGKAGRGCQGRGVTHAGIVPACGEEWKSRAQAAFFMSVSFMSGSQMALKPGRLVPHMAAGNL